MTKPQSTAAYVLRLTLTLFLITVIVAGLLAFVNYLTADTIAELSEAIRAIGDEVFGELLRGGEIDAAVGFHRGDHSRQNAAERC